MITVVCQIIYIVWRTKHKLEDKVYFPCTVSEHHIEEGAWCSETVHEKYNLFSNLWFVLFPLFLCWQLKMSCSFWVHIPVCTGDFLVLYFFSLFMDHDSDVLFECGLCLWYPHLFSYLLLICLGICRLKISRTTHNEILVVHSQVAVITIINLPHLQCDRSKWLLCLRYSESTVVKRVTQSLLIARESWIFAHILCFFFNPWNIISLSAV